MARDLAATAAGPAPNPALLLQIWLSPSFPVGAFAYSHGLEKAVELGLVRDAASLTGWIADLIAHGSIRNDLILLAAAWHAAASSDWDVLGHIAELAAALHPSTERRLESLTQGGSFRDAIAAAWPVATTGPVTAPKPLPPDLAYPVAIAIAAAGHAIPLAGTLQAYATAFCGSLASAAIRLGVIGQTGGQKLLADLLAEIAEAARAAQSANLDDLGGGCLSADLCSLEHETQYTRLFRS